jgi:hypothetical protein
MRKLHWNGDHRSHNGETALGFLRDHCYGDHSKEAMAGDYDGVMARLAKNLHLDTSFQQYAALEDRAEAFVKIALASGWLIEGRPPRL